MGGKKPTKKNKGVRALQVADDTVEMLSQSEIRKRLYLRAMQTDRLTILVGPSEMSFRVPQGLLIQHSSVFEQMQPTEQIIRLPEEDVSTFEHYFVWLHALEPSLNIESIDAIVDLAIFAEKYHVYHLKNQTLDIIKTAIIEKRWTVTPKIITKVYSNVPSNSILRQLCFSGFLIACIEPAWSPWAGHNSDNDNKSYTKWERAFNDCPCLGWDYFKHIQTKDGNGSSISFGGTCRFHDHSDIPGFSPDDCAKCPYPQGAPLCMPTEEEEKPKNELAKDIVPVEHAIVVEDRAVDCILEERVTETLPAEAEHIAEAYASDDIPTLYEPPVVRCVSAGAPGVADCTMAECAVEEIAEECPGVECTIECTVVDYAVNCNLQTEDSVEDYTAESVVNLDKAVSPEDYYVVAGNSWRRIL